MTHPKLLRRGAISSACVKISDPSHIIQSTTASREHLSDLNIVGIPPHGPILKLNFMLIIARDLHFTERIINGQKVQLPSVSGNARVLKVKLLDGLNDVLLPRTNFKPKLERNGLTFACTRFPVRVAYAYTIKKLSRSDPHESRSRPSIPCFTHRQLHVALRRARG